MMSLTGRITGHTQNQPEMPALIWHGEPTTYGQIADMMHAVRTQLDVLGPGPVGIFARKSPASIGLILGCLLAGRRVIIPSATLSSEMLGTLFDRAGCAHVLTVDADLAQDHPDLVDLVVDTTVGGHPAAATTPAPEPAPDAISWVLTTSGSTDTPKIVPLTYGAVNRFAAWAADRFDIRPGSRVLSYAPLNFDVCLLDVWATLAYGGCVVLVDAEQATNGAYLAGLLADNEVDVVQAVPTFYEILLDATRRTPAQVASVRHVLFTGDAIRPDCLAGLPAVFPRARLYNVYGCTETNDSFMADVTGLTPDTLPLGEPLPGVDSFLMTSEGTVLTGPGIGELYVATPFQTPGYLGDEAAETFVVMASDGGSRRYFKSGDLVERHPDEKLTLVGRTDFRVKVRGQQVDLQQVEQTLHHHESVLEAVTVAVPDPMAGHRLHAMVRRVPGSGLNSLALRRHCADRLPMSAVPSTVQITDAPLPKTSTGKVDRARIRDHQLKGNIVNHVATITTFIVDEFLPDVGTADLAPDYDLLAGGVIDSLALLKVVAWLEDRFGLAVDDVDLKPDNLRTVSAIDTFIRVNGPAEATVGQCAVC